MLAGPGDLKSERARARPPTERIAWRNFPRLRICEKLGRARQVTNVMALSKVTGREGGNE